MRTCEFPECTTIFEPKSTAHRFCSPGCTWKSWQRRQPSKPKRNLGIDRCAVCDEWFTVVRPDQRRCSQECSDAHHGRLRCPQRIAECDACGHEYLTRRSGQRFCSQVCAGTRKRGTRKDALVYFIEAANGPIKIGIAANPPERLRLLRGANAYPLTLRRVEPGGHKRERELHRRFADHRMEGEWFAPSPELLALLES